MRILLVEDEEKIVRMVDRALGAHGYELLSANNGEEGVRLAITEQIDLVLLDITLPLLDGYEVLRRVRARLPDLPILMLTARDDLPNKVASFDAGADDYLTKPFALEELLARIKALTRRTVHQRESVIRVGDLWMDVLHRRVRRGDIPIDLSGREFALFEYFLRHPGQVLSRRQILTAIWEYTFDPETNLVDVYVRYLRRKVDRPGKPSLITTVRGEGYRFDPPYDV